MVDPTVCHIPPVQPNAPKPTVNLPSIPLAQPNLASLTAAVNAMRQNLIFLTGQRGAQGPRGTSGSSSGSKSEPARWTEQSRVEETVRVFQNNDKTSPNWVDVKQVNKLVMKDGITGESWTWDRNRG